MRRFLGGSRDLTRKLRLGPSIGLLLGEKTKPKEVADFLSLAPDAPVVLDAVYAT